MKNENIIKGNAVANQTTITKKVFQIKFVSQQQIMNENWKLKTKKSEKKKRKPNLTASNINNVKEEDKESNKTNQ